MDRSPLQLRILRRFRKSAGQSTVEFALTVLFLILLVVGLIESIMLIYTYTVLADGAKEGVRYAIVHGCDMTTTTCSGTCLPACVDAAGDNVKAWVQNFLKASLHDSTAMVVDVNWPDAGGAASNNTVQVTVRYPYQPFFGLRWPTVTVRAHAEGKIFY